MPKKMLIDATHSEETRVVVVDGNKVEEFDFESESRRQLAGNIYLAKVTRVEPSLQAAFVDYGGNRHGFLAFTEIHPDYYQIPVADREALLAEEAEMAREEDEEEKPKRRSRGRSRSKVKAEATKAADETASAEVADGEAGAEAGPADSIPGMDFIDLDADADMADAPDAARDAQDRRDHSAAEDEAPDADEAHGAASDDEIESVAEEDVNEEIRRPRKPRARKYKIQEVIKVRQIMLVQVVKEERGNKGAALTTYLSLAGRYCVLMPNTARGGGISRKITNVADRKKLKEIAGSIDVPKGAGLIIRTAGSQRTKTEIKRDYEYLQRMWEQIRELTLQSIAPAKIYEEGDLIKRSIRDLYNREIDEVWVEGIDGYRVAKDFMKMIMPSHAKNVKHYQDPLPLFARYQVESYLTAMFNPVVQLKSGGYIVIGVTEALVAIDVNSGRATKKGSIEETALETNLEAAEEIARQLRLRDLAGLIVIDFIDMEERKNNASVEKRFKDRLKTDRARIQVGRISGFGLLEMSRQRLRPGMLEATTQPCPACHGTGLLRSDDSLALGILRQLEEEGVRRRTKEVLVKVPFAIANFLMNQKREHIAQIEARYGLSVRIEADPTLISPDYTIEKFKTATRVVEQTAPVVSADASLMSDPEDEVEVDTAAAEPVEAEAEDGDDQQPKKRRRRRRRRKNGGNGDSAATDEGSAASSDEDSALQGDGQEEAGEGSATDAADEGAAEAGAEAEESAAKPKRRSRSRSRKRAEPVPQDQAEPAAADASAEAAQADAAPAEPAAPVAPVQAASPEPQDTPDAFVEAEPPVAVEAPEEPAEDSGQDAAEPEAPEDRDLPSDTGAVQPEGEREPALAEGDNDASKPRRRGWWSLGR